MKERGIAERRGCKLFSISRSHVRYESRKRDDALIEAKLKRISTQYKRYGYRRAKVELEKAGFVVNRKRVLRLWRKLGLSLPMRRKRKKRGKTGSVPLKALHPNHVWTYDFVHDRMENGRKLKFLTVVDEFTRESLSIEVGFSITASDVIAVLKRLFAEYGEPAFIRSDNGPEFTADAIVAWIEERGARTKHIDPGKPWQNAFGESFNSRFRDEFLNMELFLTLCETRIKAEMWRDYYNMERPHSSLDYLSPTPFRLKWEQESRSAAPPEGLSLLGFPAGEGKENGRSKTPHPPV